MTAGSPPLLTVDSLTMRFGGLTAIHKFSFSVKPGEIAAIIGPNGAGKTTVFNCLTGFYRPQSGHMQLNSDGTQFSLERMKAFRIARDARVVRTFQNVRLFGGMTVLENLIVAQDANLMRGAIFSMVGFGPASAIKPAVEQGRYWLDRIGLLHSAELPAAHLAYGAQRRLEIARAMCASPVLLCLDEPAAGLNPRESEGLNALILGIRSEHGTAILLIEHDMSVVMGVSDRVIVLDHGICIADGTPAEIRADRGVIRAYLGETV
jgi:branched-chain amino acid transport system ATP-binding protein